MSVFNISFSKWNQSNIEMIRVSGPWEYKEQSTLIWGLSRTTKVVFKKINFIWSVRNSYQLPLPFVIHAGKIAGYSAPAGAWYLHPLSLSISCIKDPNSNRNRYIFHFLCLPLAQESWENGVESAILRRSRRHLPRPPQENESARHLDQIRPLSRRRREPNLGTAAPSGASDRQILACAECRRKAWPPPADLRRSVASGRRGWIRRVSSNSLRFRLDRGRIRLGWSF